jgi:hypothetical protein
LSSNGGVCDELPGSEMKWLVGNRIPENKKKHNNEEFNSTNFITPVCDMGTKVKSINKSQSSQTYSYY